MSITLIKLIALASMTLDHIGFFLFPDIIALRVIGRAALPLFLFALSEALFYTHNVKAYILRLFVMFEFMLAFDTITPYIIHGSAPLINNIFGTLLLTAIYSQALNMIVSGVRHKQKSKSLLGALLCIAPVISAIPAIAVSLRCPDNIAAALAAMALPSIFSTEGSIAYALLGVSFFVCKKYFTTWATTARVLLILSAGVMVFIKSSGADAQGFMALAAIPAALYNETCVKKLKPLFYAYYPCHILILFLIQANIKS